jgi:hypothetical protein
MRNLTRVAGALALAGLLTATGASAQFGKLKLPGKSGGAPTSTAALENGRSMMQYLTVASDCGMAALEQVATVFPADKIARFKEISAKYREAQKTRKDGNIDAQSFEQVNEASAEIAKLKENWQEYSKERGPAVRKSHYLLGLMMLADAQASRQTPEVVSGLNAELQSIAADPTQASRANEIRGMVSTLTVVSQKLPGQISNFQTVRAITKQIADAEKYQLPEEAKADQVSTAKSLENSSRELTD